MGRWEDLKSATSVTEGKTLLKSDALFKLVGVGGQASVATDTSLRARAPATTSSQLTREGGAGIPVSALPKVPLTCVAIWSTADPVRVFLVEERAVSSPRASVLMGTVQRSAPGLRGPTPSALQDGSMSSTKSRRCPSRHGNVEC